MAGNSSVVPLASPKPMKVAYRRTNCWVLRGPCLRAPGLRLPFAPSRLLHPMGRCSPRSAVAPPPKRADVRFPCRSVSNAPAHAPRGQQRGAAVHVVHRSRPQATAAPSLLGQASRRWAVAPSSRPKAQRRPPYRAHWPVSGRSSRYRASLLHRPVECTGRCKKYAPARMPLPRSLPVECTGRTTRPGNTRPNAPHVAVPRGLATMRAAGSTHVASSTDNTMTHRWNSPGEALRTGTIAAHKPRRTPMREDVKGSVKGNNAKATLAVEKHDEPRPGP